MNPIILALLGMVPDMVKRLFPGETTEESLKRMELQTDLTKALIEADKSQMAVNQEEAKSGSLFVAGWRPFVGWACAVALVYSTMGIHLINAILVANGHPALPPFDANELSTILYGMLGIGSMRSVEKVNAVKDSLFKKK